jgi:hypothetical protein
VYIQEKANRVVAAQKRAATKKRNGRGIEVHERRENLGAELDIRSTE